MLTEKRLAPVVGNRRMVGAEQQLALGRCGERLGHVDVHSIAAAAGLLIEVSEAEDGDVVKNAHQEIAAERTST